MNQSRLEGPAKDRLVEIARTGNVVGVDGEPGNIGHSGSIGEDSPAALAIH